MKFGIIIFIAFFFFLLYPFLYAEIYYPEVEKISNSDYFQPTLNAVKNAKESIVMGMYIISLPTKEEADGVRELLKELISAKERGVYVKVIIEYHSAVDLTPEGFNYYAYRYLKENGIDVCFDESPTRCLHLKTIVIDKEVIISGSSNWSGAAFRSSYETNFILRSKPLALAVLRDLEEIPLRKEFVKEIENAFPVPCSFLSKYQGVFRTMVTFDDERSFDIILLLWCVNKNVVSCDFIAENLGLTKRLTREGWRRQIKKTLRKLEGRYNLVRYKWHHGKDNIEIELLNFPGENPVKFPRDYFKYGWDKRLGLSAKVVLLTMYAELKEVVGNVVSLPILYLSKKYGMKVFTYSSGIQELKRFNIIKVQYAKGFKERADTRIAILGVYSIEAYNREVEELGARYGEKSVGEAQGLAGIVYSAYDIYVVKDILKQIDFYGIDAVRDAFAYVKKMRVDNYKRTYNYVLGILRRHGREG